MSVDATETDVTAPTTLMELRDLRKSYGDVQILAGIDFTVRRGEFVCVVGPSGSGKTTLLRCMAGLLAPTDGACLFEGDTVTGPPAKLAVVFQDYSRSLFPWLSVADNIELPLRRTVRKAERAVRIDSVLTAVGLAGKHDLYPWQMSGGMQQRAAIARGLAYQPDVLLMDEPFAAVDAQTRADLEDLVRKVRKDLGISVLFVTHDIDESVYLAERVIMLSSSPTVVQEDLVVDLPAERDQLNTRSLPRFTQLRHHVYEQIQLAKKGFRPDDAVVR